MPRTDILTRKEEEREKMEHFIVKGTNSQFKRETHTFSQFSEAAEFYLMWKGILQNMEVYVCKKINMEGEN